MTDLKPCACGGKPWFNLQSIQCLKCNFRLPKRFGNFDKCAAEWNKAVQK